ncbi:MAG: glycosyltransferase family 2 protein [Myxococcales bacterium]|nr:glycosyltransferase family 2 protein [Myxococcales bacterium]
MDNSLRFTLLMGTYNHAKYLPTALDHVLSQTRPPERIVFFDDGSRDDSFALARARFAGDPRVVFVPDADRNMGLLTRMRLARPLLLPGSFVVQHAGDDMLDRACFARHAENLSRRAARWSVAAIDAVDEESGEFLYAIKPDPAVLESAAPLLERLLRGAPFPPVHGWAYHTALLDEVGGYDPGFAMEDLPLLFRFAARERPSLTDATVCAVRVRPNQYARWRGQLPRDAARLALESVRQHPRAALEYASRQYMAAATGSARHRAWADALADLTRAVALWPVPTAPHFVAPLKKLKTRLVG